MVNIVIDDCFIFKCVQNPLDYDRVHSELNWIGVASHPDKFSIRLRGPVFVVVAQHLTQQLDIVVHLFQHLHALRHFLHPDVIL